MAVAVSSPETIAWTARHGYRMLSSGLGTPLARSLENRVRYEAALHAAGHDAATIARLLGEWTVTKHVYVAPTDAEAEADARGPEEWYLDAFRRSLRTDGLPGLDPEVRARTERMQRGHRGAAMGEPAAGRAAGRLARHRAGARGRATGGGRGRAGVLDELRRPATRQGTALDAAFRRRSDARLPQHPRSRAHRLRHYSE